MLHRAAKPRSHPTRAIVFGADEHYRVSHHIDGGNECETHFRPET